MITCEFRFIGTDDDVDKLHGIVSLFSNDFTRIERKCVPDNGMRNVIYHASFSSDDYVKFIHMIESNKWFFNEVGCVCKNS